MIKRLPNVCEALDLKPSMASNKRHNTSPSPQSSPVLHFISLLHTPLDTPVFCSRVSAFRSGSISASQPDIHTTLQERQPRSHVLCQRAHSSGPSVPWKHPSQSVDKDGFQKLGTAQKQTNQTKTEGSGAHTQLQSSEAAWAL